MNWTLSNTDDEKRQWNEMRNFTNTSVLFMNNVRLRTPKHTHTLEVTHTQQTSNCSQEGLHAQTNKGENPQTLTHVLITAVA